jgi:hypothetical protein
VLFDDRSQIGPLITGLRQLFQVLGGIGHVQYGDGTTLAAVKTVLNVACPTGREHCGQSMLPDGRIVTNGPAAGAAPAARAGAAAAAAPAAAAQAPAPLSLAPALGGLLPRATTGAQAIVDLLGTVLLGPAKPGAHP